MLVVRIWAWDKRFVLRLRVEKRREQSEEKSELGGPSNFFYGYSKLERFS